MELLWEITKFTIFSVLIVLISKYILVRTLRSLAENLNLKSKTVGAVAGIATSVPELLTISASSINGLLSASIYNIFCSNIINFIQYVTTIIINKNQKELKNKAIKIDIILVIITIILPIMMYDVKNEKQLTIIPVLILLYLLFKIINNRTHKLYIKREKVDEKNNNGKKINTIKVFKDIIILLITVIFLYLIGELLGSTLKKLCSLFNISEITIGIVLGFVTSIPELITFFEAQRHHKQSENNILGVIEATNNLLTSNMMNIFIIQSIGIILFWKFGTIGTGS